MAGPSAKSTATVYLNGVEQNNSIKDLNDKIRRLNAEIKRLDPTTDEFIKKSKELRQVKDRFKELTDEVNGTGGMFKKIQSELGRVGTLAVAYLGFDYVTGKIGNIIQSNAELSDSFADIQKSTGLTAEQVKDLDQRLGELDTRTSKADLRAIAVVAGQIGIANDQLVSFVENTNKAVVALGDEFSGGAEQVAKEFGSIKNLYSELKGVDAGKVINDVGSAVNALGAAGTATGPVITDFTQRVGQLGGLKPTVSQTLGLGAAFQELGLQAEVAAGGVGRVLIEASGNISKFDESLQGLINSDPNAFLMELAKSFQGVSNTEIGTRLKDLGINSQEAIKVIQALANNTDLVVEKQQLAAKSMKEGTSLTQEYNIKNNNLAGSLEKLRKEFNSLLTSNEVKEFLVSQVNNAKAFIATIKDVIGFIGRNKSEIVLLAAAFASIKWGESWKDQFNTAKNSTLDFLKSIKTNIQAQYELNKAMIAVHSDTLPKATGSFTKLRSAASGTFVAIKDSTKSMMTSLKESFMANPIGFLVTSLLALVSALEFADRFTSTTIRNNKLKEKAFKDLGASINYTDEQMKSLNDQVSKYNQLSQQERQNLEKQLALQLKLAEQTLKKAKAEQMNSGKRSGESRWYDSNILQFLGAQDDLATRSKKAVAEFDQTIEKATSNVESLRNSLQSVQEKANSLKIADDIFGKANDIAGFSEALRMYQQALQLAVPGSKDFIRAQEGIAKSQEKVNELTKAEVESSKEAIEARKKAIEIYQKYFREILKLRIEMIDDEQSRELANLEFNKKIRIEDLKNAEGNAQQKATLLKLIEEKYLKDVAKINKAYQDKRAEAEYEESVLELERWLTKRKTMINLDFVAGKITKEEMNNQLRDTDSIILDSQLEVAKSYGKKVEHIELEIAQFKKEQREKEIQDTEAKNNLIIENTISAMEDLFAQTPELFKTADWDQYLSFLQDQLVEGFKLTEGQIAEIKIKYFKAAEKAEKDYFAKMSQRYRAAGNFLGSIQELIDPIQQLANMRINKELEADKTIYESWKKRIQSQYEQGLISQEEYNSKISKIDANWADKQRENKRAAFERTRDAQLIGMGIDMAKSVTSILAEYPKFDGGIAMFAALATTAALGAAQMAVVRNQPIPEFAVGTNFAPGGLALVGEQGPEIVNLPRGSKVKTAASSSMDLSALTQSVMFLASTMSSNLNSTNLTLSNPVRLKADSIGNLTSNSNEINAQLLMVIERINKTLEKGIDAKAVVGDKFIQDLTRRKNRLDNLNSPNSIGN